MKEAAAAANSLLANVTDLSLANILPVEIPLQKARGRKEIEDV